MTVLVESITCKMESEFYVTLPSNSSMQYFSDNKTSNFVTKLSRTLQLDGEWEVGLAKIDYPHTWYNICEGKNSVEIYTSDKLYLVFQTVRPWASRGNPAPPLKDINFQKLYHISITKTLV